MQENIGDDTANAVLWLLQDNLQSVRDVVNNAGQTINSIEYGPYGNILSITDPSNGNAVLSAAATRFLFTGQEWDAKYLLCPRPVDRGRPRGPRIRPRDRHLPLPRPGHDRVNGYIYAKEQPHELRGSEREGFCGGARWRQGVLWALGDTFSSGEDI